MLTKTKNQRKISFILTSFKIKLKIRMNNKVMGIMENHLTLMTMAQFNH